MKNVTALFCILMFLAINCYAEETKAQAQQQTKPAANETDTSPIDTRDYSFQKTPLNKLTRGAVNTASFLLEVPASIWDVSEKRNPLAGVTLGTVEGIALSIMRLGSGLFDALTFVFPPYDKPFMTPEYAFESAIEKMTH